MSRQRDEILNVIARSDMHLSAEEIFMHLKGIGENISIATVYRNLNILSDKGFIKKISVGDGVERYDKSTKPHGHLVCTSCGSIRDIALEGFKSYLEEKSGEALTSYELCMRCVCPECIKTEALKQKEGF
ncbi:MAG: transcriptional repressor [Eubacterium sp.]|nr:transcriptional repressor [Eubacterium sp.]